MSFLKHRLNTRLPVFHFSFFPFPFPVCNSETKASGWRGAHEGLDKQHFELWWGNFNDVLVPGSKRPQLTPFCSDPMKKNTTFLFLLPSPLLLQSQKLIENISGQSNVWGPQYDPHPCIILNNNKKALQLLMVAGGGREEREEGGVLLKWQGQAFCFSEQKAPVMASPSPPLFFFKRVRLPWDLSFHVWGRF